MNKCFYCLCKICTRFGCPRGRWHCHMLQCVHGTVLECDFFSRRKVTKFYRIRSRSKALSVDQLKRLRDLINDILDEVPAPEEPVLTMHEQIQKEQLRHRAELKRIVREAQEKRDN